MQYSPEVAPPQRPRLDFRTDLLNLPNVLREAAKGKGMKRVIWLIVCVLLGVGLLGGGAAGLVSGQSELAEARSWPSTDGRIEESRVNSRWVSGRRAHWEYRPVVAYSYEVAGKPYRNDDIALAGTFTSRSRSSAQEMLLDYPFGGKVRVYYSPGDPGHSTLRVETQSGVWYFLMVVGVLFLGLAGYLEMKRRRA